MEITKADLSDIKEILDIYSDARAFMRAAGNMEQWSGGYPSEDTVREDISLERLYVCRDNGSILCVFCYFEGIDPTYVNIYEGEWLNSLPYGVIHRIAAAANSHGRNIAGYCFEYCFSRCGNLKIDTHRDNIPMQKALAKNGFERCGIIYLANGDERIAFQKVK